MSGSRRASIIPAVLLLLLLLLLLLAAGVPAAAAEIWNSTGSQAETAGRWPDISEVEGAAWVVLDSQSGTALIEKNADQAVFPASTTKIMTAILALEADILDRVATVSANAVKLPSGSSKIGLIAGEEIAVRDLLAGLMLASGNDAANALAETISGSQEAFAGFMNAKAALLGMNGSHFCNPSGLHDPAHVMTARDMAVLAAYAMKNQQFRSLVATVSYALPATNKHPYPGWALFNNTNRFLQFGPTVFRSGLLDHYEGIKTGSTSAAGNNLVAAAMTRSGRELISVLFGVPLNTKIGNPFIYSRTLLEAAAAQTEATAVPTAALTASATTVASTTPAKTAASTDPAASATSAAAVVSGTPATSDAATGTTGIVKTEPNADADDQPFFPLQIDPWLVAFLAMTAVALTVSLLFAGYVRQVRLARRRAARVRPTRPR